MDFATYWLVVPIVGIALTIAFWMWAWTTRTNQRGAHPSADVVRRQ